MNKSTIHMPNVKCKICGAQPEIIVDTINSKLFRLKCSKCDIDSGWWYTLFGAKSWWEEENITEDVKNE